MSSRFLLLAAGSFVLGCAPAFPPRPELPPISPQVAEAHGPSAPVIPKPDLSTVSSELRAATTSSGEGTPAANPGRR